MKSQDILIALKLICLEQKEKEFIKKREITDFIEENPETLLVEQTDNYFSNFDSDEEQDDVEFESDEEWDELEFDSESIAHQETEWKGWLAGDPAYEKKLVDENNLNNIQNQYSVRGLASLTGISKTEVGKSLKRSISAGIAYYDRKNNLPRVSRPIIYNFIIHGLKYVFPVSISLMTRGIPTSFASPALREHVETAGGLIYVWPDPEGKEMGQSIEPLFPSVPFAVRQDRQLYEFLALIDAIRLGNAREVKLAKIQLEKGLMK